MASISKWFSEHLQWLQIAATWPSRKILFSAAYWVVSGRWLSSDHEEIVRFCKETALMIAF